MKQSAEGAKRGFPLWTGVVLVAVLATVAYLSGSRLARSWMGPSLALPSTPSTTQVPKVHVAVSQIAPDGDPVESELGPEEGDTWQFQGHAGQSITIEVWFHPGAGSNMDAELVVQLVGPDGTVLVEEPGSTVLPPYLVEPRLPADGLYQIRLVPTTGTPGRYSLGLALSEPGDVTPGATPRATGVPSPGQGIAAASKNFQWPTPGRAISGWTFRDPRKPSHIGLDIAASMQDPIVAVADGTVSFAEWGGGYGNLVVLTHGDNWQSYYAHLSRIVVGEGQEVRQGELLGGGGSTGNSTGPHLHFELRYQGRPVDPHIYLP